MTQTTAQNPFRAHGQEPEQLRHERDTLGLRPRRVVGKGPGINAVIALHEGEVNSVWKQSYSDYHTLTFHLAGAELVRKRGRHGASALSAPGSFSLQQCTDESLWTADGRCRWVQFYLPVAFVGSIAEELFEADDTTVTFDRATGIKDTRLLRPLYRILARLNVDPAPTAGELNDWSFNLSRILLETHSNLKASRTQPRERLTNAKYRLAKRFIDDRFDGRITTAEIAAAVGMSTYHFCRAFKNHAGQSPYQYVIGRRVDRAREMLEKTTKPISEITYDAGFSSQAHMTSTFTRTLGVPPGVYRNHIVKS
jgi:AraC family transcriptional regulator